MASNAKALSFLSGDLSLSGTEVSINVAGSVQSDSITGSTITMKNTGSTIVASDGSTTVLSESGGVVTLTADAAVIEGSSSGDLVRITQTGTGNALVVEDSANPDSTPFVVEAGGLVGIGTSSPTSNLEISASTNTGVRLTTTADSTPFFDFRTNGTDRLRISSSSATGATFNVRSNQDMQFYTNNTERMRINSNGNVLVGTTTSTGAKFDIKQTIAEVIFDLNHTNSGTQYFQYFRYNGTAIGSILGSNTSTSFNETSDYRLKENITNITDGITRVKQLNPSRFNFITDPDRIVDGFIAHEVQDIVPEAISGEKDAVNGDGSINPQGIDQSKLVPLLTAALQEAIGLIESQQSQIDTLTTKTQEQDFTIASLISRIEALENP